MILKPETANVFAESPSVNNNLHLYDSFLPALLASSNFGIPFNIPFFLPSVFFNSLLALLSTIAKISSVISVAANFFIKLAEISHVLPKSLIEVVKVSLV